MDVEIEEGDDQQLVSRSYQTQLEEIALARNTIIHLPTGSGKTFIAVRLINRCRHSLKQPWGSGGKRTFFLVNTIPLVDQQKKVIRSLCAVKSVAGYSGEDGIDYWDKSKWDAELSKHQVIVMTSQILADMLTHSYIRIDDINLLIFDECHHAVVDHPMRLVMKHFGGCPADKQPRVLGLTATLLNCNVNISKVEETLRDLETTFHATIATVNELGEVLNYSTNPNEYIKYHRPIQLSSDAHKALEILNDLQIDIIDIKLPRVTGDPSIKLEKWQRDISADPKKIVKEVKNMVTSMMNFIEELGVYGGALSILAYIILLERLKRKALSVPEEKLYKFVITHSTMARMILLDSMKTDNGYHKIIKHSSEKVVNMLNMLKEFNPGYYNSPAATMKVNIARQPLSGIIFTKQRFTAKIIYNILKDVKESNPEEFGFLKHDFIVGFNINPYKCTREEFYHKKSSQTALLKFGNKELNCLISTSVIEEGVDIPQCMLVLRYDPPLEYRSYIQSKGRARRADSTFVIMLNINEKEKFLNQYTKFREMERYIQQMLVGKSDVRGAPTQEQIDDLYKEDEVPPYVTKLGARLSSVQAISLLNRYCSVLPHDQFTVITPMWIEEKVYDARKGPQKQVKIYMPIACPIKDIITGQPSIQLKTAKRSAALNACIKLHEEGELDSLTLLPRHYGIVDFDQPEVRSCFPNWPWDETPEVSADIPKTGTKKRVRTYKKVFPAYLQRPKNNNKNQKYYLHVVKLRTAFKEPTDSRDKALYDFLQEKSGYGFLTHQALPKLCEFSNFLVLGEVKTYVEMNYAVITLDRNQFEVVKSFHLFLFDQVLEVAKKFTVYDGTENCLYTVPLKCNTVAGQHIYDIDWHAMHTYKEIRPVVQPSYEERKAINVTEEKYKHHVVSPWYRGSILPARYIVSNIVEYKTPYSHFDSNDESGTFVDYYYNKYCLEIVGDKNQPLLEVKNINSRFNCILPRAPSFKQFTEKQVKMISMVQGEDKPKGGFPELFVPEFCILYEYPGSMWYKATMLPTIVHRILMMLVAYELRSEIARDQKIGQVHLPPNTGQQWLPLHMNKQVAASSLLSLVENTTPIQNVDRINNPIDDDAPRPMNIVAMKQTLYQLQKKKISEEYNWDEKTEPIDIERNIATVTVMDVECYDEFMSAFASAQAPTEAKSVRSPPHQFAILPPPVQPICKIKILAQKPTPRGPELRDVLAAITTINSKDNFDLERMETLGDSFLKFATSLYLSSRFSMLNEGQLTNIKCRLLGNRNLYYAGAKVQLGGRMKIEQFTPTKDFLVPGFFAPTEVQEYIEQKNVRPTCLIGMEFSSEEILSGKLSEESREQIRQKFSDDSECTSLEQESPYVSQPAMQCYVRSQAVSDKCVADCVEALIGTYILSEGILGGVKVLEWFKVLPAEHNFTEILTKKLPRVMTKQATNENEINRLMNYSREDVETILGYKFNDPTYLLEALSHPSYIRNRLTRSYERLEFLGDAILDFLITAHIFETCPDLKPGELTDLRSALVNNVTFAAYVVKLGLHKFLCYQLNPALETAIIAFIDHQEKRDHAIEEDVLYLIDEEDCKIAEYVEVPKVLSDIFESLAAAIYLDSGGNFEIVWEVYYRIMAKEIHTFSRRIPLQPVRMLYEKIHACPEFGKTCVPDANVQKVMVPVTVTKQGKQHTVHGFGNNKFQARRAAAKLALKFLENRKVSSLRS